MRTGFGFFGHGRYDRRYARSPERAELDLRSGDRRGGAARASSEDIVAACKTVYDPEIPCDIYELGLIYKIAGAGEPKLVAVQMTLTAPGCPVAGDIVASVEEAVGGVGGAMGAAVDLVFDPPWDQGRMSDEARISLDMF